MPVSVEQWRASVGLNNAARGHLWSKWGRRKSTKNLLEQLMSFVLALFSVGTGSVTDQAAPTTSYHPRNKTSGHTHKGGGWGWLYAAFSITVVTLLLWCSGDVELNPGPLSGPFADNLVHVCNLTSEASVEWYNLGLELGLTVETLDIIKADNSQDTRQCFLKMLWEWLKRVSPPPTWEALIEALSVRCGNVAKKVKRACGLEEEDATPSATVPRPPGQAGASDSDIPGSVSVQKQIDDLDEHFGLIMSETYNKVKQSGMDVGRLRVYLTCIPAKYKGEHNEFFREIDGELDECSSVDTLWTKLNQYWDYLNYTLLESLIWRLGDHSLNEKMNHYSISLKSFQNGTRLCDFVKASRSITPTVRADLKDFVLRLKLDWEVCTLRDLDELAGQVIRKFNLPSFGMILKRKSYG